LQIPVVILTGCKDAQICFNMNDVLGAKVLLKWVQQISPDLSYSRNKKM